MEHLYGQFIDSHDIVMRMNMHQCHSPKNCGFRTTHRMFNNQFCQHKTGSGRILKSMDKNVTVLFNSFISDWDCMYRKMNGAHLLPCFNDVAKLSPKSRFALDPLFIQSAVTAFERLSNKPVKTLLSTGFLAMYFLTKTCTKISAFGFCSIDNYNNRWHNFDSEHAIYNQWSKSDQFDLKMYP